MSTPIHVTLAIKKLDAEQRKAYGWVSIVEDAQGNPIVDYHGHVIPIGVLEKAVHEAFASGSGAGKGGDLHERQGIIDVIEGVVVTAEKRAVTDSPFAKEGPAGWWAGFQVNDAETWAMVKNGSRPELSLLGQGEGVRLQKRDDGTVSPDAKVLITKVRLDEMEWFSTVDRGASGNDDHRPRIVLWKRKQEINPMTVQDLLKSLEGKAEAIEVVKRLDLKKQMTPELLEILTGLKPEQQAVILAAIEAGAPAAKPEPAAPPPNPGPPVPEPMAKRKDVPEDVKAELKKRDEEISDLRKRQEAAEDKALTIELEKRFDADWKYLPGEQVEWVELVKAVRKGKLTDELAKRFEDKLVQLSKAMQESPLLKPMGRDTGSADGSAKAEALALAKKLMDDKPTMGEAIALRKIYEARPELYKRVRDEQHA